MQHRHAIQAPQNAAQWSKLGFNLTDDEAVDIIGLGSGYGKKECFAEAVRCDNGDGAAWNNLGFLMGSKDRVELCGRTLTKKDCFSESLMIDPHNGAAWNNLGFALVDGEKAQVQGQTVNRRDCFLSALELDQNDSAAWNNVGYSLDNPMDKVKVSAKVYTKRECFINALHCDVRNSAAWFNIAKCLHSGESVMIRDQQYTSQACLIQAINSDPTYVDAWEWLAQSINVGQTITVAGRVVDREFCLAEARRHRIDAGAYTSTSLTHKRSLHGALEEQGHIHQQLNVNTVQMTPRISLAHRTVQQPVQPTTITYTQPPSVASSTTRIVQQPQVEVIQQPVQTRIIQQPQTRVVHQQPQVIHTQPQPQQITYVQRQPQVIQFQPVLIQQQPSVQYYSIPVSRQVYQPIQASISFNNSQVLSPVREPRDLPPPSPKMLRRDSVILRREREEQSNAIRTIQPKDAAGWIRVVEMEPENTIGWYNLGLTLKEKERVKVHGQDHTALDCFARALTLNSRDAQTWNNVGAYLVHEGDTVHVNNNQYDAMQCFQCACENDINYIEPWTNLSRCLDCIGGTARVGGQNYTAADCREMAARAEPRRAIIDDIESSPRQTARQWYSLGDTLHGSLWARVHSEKLRQVDCYQRALSIDPNSGSAWSRMGHCMQVTGEHRMIINGEGVSRRDCFARAVEKDQESAAGWRNLGRDLGPHDSTRVLGTQVTRQDCFDNASRCPDRAGLASRYHSQLGLGDSHHRAFKSGPVSDTFKREV